MENRVKQEANVQQPAGTPDFSATDKQAVETFMRATNDLMQELSKKLIAGDRLTPAESKFMHSYVMIGLQVLMR